MRLVEYVQGNDGVVLGHEFFLYVFDALLMLGVVGVFNVIHPSEIKAMPRGGRMVQNVVQVRHKQGRVVVVEAEDVDVGHLVGLDFLWFGVFGLRR